MRRCACVSESALEVRYGMRTPTTFLGPSARAASVATTAESTPPDTPTTAFAEAAACELVLEEVDQPGLDQRGIDVERRRRAAGRDRRRRPRRAWRDRSHAPDFAVSGVDGLRSSVLGLRSTALQRPLQLRLQLRQHRAHVREQRRVGAGLGDVVEVDARGQQRLLERRRVRARVALRADRRASRPGTCARPRCRRVPPASRTRRALRRCHGSAGPSAPRSREPRRRRRARTRRARARRTRRTPRARRRAPRSVP